MCRRPRTGVRLRVDTIYFRRECENRSWSRRRCFDLRGRIFLQGNFSKRVISATRLSRSYFGSRFLPLRTHVFEERSGKKSKRDSIASSMDSTSLTRSRPCALGMMNCCRRVFFESPALLVHYIKGHLPVFRSQESVSTSQPHRTHERGGLLRMHRRDNLHRNELDRQRIRCKQIPQTPSHRLSPR